MIGRKQAQNIREVLNEFHMHINPVKQTCISDASANTHFMQILTGCYVDRRNRCTTANTSIVPAVMVGLNLLRAGMVNEELSP